MYAVNKPLYFIMKMNKILALAFISNIKNSSRYIILCTYIDAPSSRDIRSLKVVVDQIFLA